jgi:hypothetical protein
VYYPEQHCNTATPRTGWDCRVRTVRTLAEYGLFLCCY